ncbi:HEXXH motif domain-containing protein [Nonomuraea sp. SBT364]|uniref:HEXXH motif domain-containing protein n=1 Tax=Nonomuraea sp. SBT364 TaxID=1580530 RepID=UPI000A752365|nr:HEXXH motif domain-containing protein [Nonomuraea sp. SBT364]
MSAVRHRISAGAFATLATGAGGSGAVKELCAAQASKHRLLLRFLVEETRRVGHHDAPLVAAAYEVLSELEERFPEQVDRCLRYPVVGAWLLRTCRALPAGGAPGRLAAIALAAAVRAGAACRLRVPVGDGELMLPTLGRLALPGGLPDVAEVAVEPVGGGAEVRAGGHPARISPMRDGPGWQVLHRVPGTPGLSLTIDDLDPYRWPGDDVDGRLTAERRERWFSCLRGAWEVLTGRHHAVAAELATAVSVLTPVRALDRDQHSASARDAFGAIALSDPLDGLGLAVILAHELQHAKLNALSEVVELIRPDDGRRYYAPWRPDPRPLFGLLHGAYAHAAVAGFWRVHAADAGIGPRAEVEFARWREAAYQVSTTLLDSGGLTEAGQELVGSLRGVLGGWRAEPVTPSSAARARLLSERHRRQARLR